jgi:hypothetical protein
MGKKRFIDHRQPPRSAGVPQVLRNGTKVPASPEPEIETDEVVQLRRRTVKQRTEIEELDRKLRVKSAEVAALKQQLQNARDETRNVLREAQQPELEGHTPERIEIVTVDDISRENDVATMKVLADLDGTVGETNIVVPVQQLKSIIRQKQRKSDERSAKPSE